MGEGEVAVVAEGVEADHGDGEMTAAAVKEVVEAMQAAVMVAAVMPAMVASTS